MFIITPTVEKHEMLLTVDHQLNEYLYYMYPIQMFRIVPKIIVQIFHFVFF